MCETTDHAQIEAEIAKGCRALYLETPTNPTTKILDIERLAGALVIVDNASALAIARYLESHVAVERVHYPGLASHEGHEIAARQMRGFGGMLSFTLKENSFEAIWVVL